MARGSKEAYSDKQIRKAHHIEEGYEERGVKKKEAQRRAWSTVNKESGGGKRSGSGRKKGESMAPRSASFLKRSAAAKKGWATRHRQQQQHQHA